MTSTLTSDPYNTKKKRVPWNDFDALLNCFKNDRRQFLVNDTGRSVTGNHPMDLNDMISFWDGGIATTRDRKTMLEILTVASNLAVGQTSRSTLWKIKRVS